VQFIQDSVEGAAVAIRDSLQYALDRHSRVLWLVPGGSSITIAVAAMRAIPADLTAKLHIMLTDERYGPVDHADSNFRQLTEAGFDPQQATFVPTLAGETSLEETAAAYSADFERESSEAGFIIAHFGIGADCHIAGILPDSPAARAETMTSGYSGGQFKRLTLTFSALGCIDIAFATVYGEAKRPALEALYTQAADQVVQPCQILHTIPESYVYNDNIAGETT
jgi:6-phosphogluconolactonase/glucosamine-6-phosphate isomerase/deaminase